VRGIGGTAAYTENEQAAFFFTHLCQQRRYSLKCLSIQLSGDILHLSQELARKIHLITSV
jgi:hypothetical protein